MSDSTSEGRPEPDFLDRLLARHAAPAAQRSGVVRVRPRLAGPFERVEAVRAAAPDPDGTGPLWPVAAPAPVARPDGTRPAAREVVRTERERTVVRTELAPAPDVPALRPARPAESEGPLLRPITPTGPVLRPAPDTARRAAGRGRTERAPTNAVSVPTPPGADAAFPAAVSAPLLPSAADTAAARDAVRQAAARRPGRPTEQVVQVQIGRLEVTAGGAPQGGGDRPRPRDTERPRAAVSLADYLARGRE
ncbi:hypothetical protein [Streptomyces violaceus]|uniref:Uncharacterized protein n=1 Tax=Streptomyces violaceus TaxID=1936 RepID=A0ABY9UKF8_STRVL|nr:hypothetical protein [Streptomyces janthinus]WND22721.1 hypothetical protein RI060_37590 [Streptomyces janthinus]GGS97670.1 hypothetical protein GCM10010270_82060 [Streptomyces janthinus]